jgi:DNA-binding transcriptional MocR family regulator
MNKSEKLVSTIQKRIANQALKPGDRLPSVRGFAQQMKMSPSTVVDAYDRLVGLGIITSRKGAGFFVSRQNLPPISVKDQGPSRKRAVDPFWVSRQSLDADPSYLMPGCGWLPADWMPNAIVKKALRDAATRDDVVLSEYGSTRGSPALRQILMRRYADEGLDMAADQIILTMSGTHAIDLICRLFLRDGDCVVVDDPCYFNFQALLRAHGVKIVSVPFTPNGPDVAAFERVVQAEKPRLYITNSALHNPTGASWSPAVAHRVLSLAEQHDLTIVEDDIWADLEPSLSPRLATLDGLTRVIKIGSFSKAISASLRCGFIAARADWIEQLIDLQLATNFGGPSPLISEAFVRILSSGTFRKYLSELTVRLEKSRDNAIEQLATIGPRPWVVPRGGYYLWCALPDGINATTLAQAALDRKMVLAPGNVFSHTQTAGQFMRFNVAHMQDQKYYRLLADLLARH